MEICLYLIFQSCIKWFNTLVSLRYHTIKLVRKKTSKYSWLALFWEIFYGQLGLHLMVKCMSERTFSLISFFMCSLFLKIWMLKQFVTKIWIFIPFKRQNTIGSRKHSSKHLKIMVTKVLRWQVISDYQNWCRFSTYYNTLKNALILILAACIRHCTFCPLIKNITIFEWLSWIV